MKLHSRSCPDMACIVYGSHSVTCTPMHLSANGINRSSLSLISQSWYSFTNPWGMEDWVVQTNRMASKQSAHDWYIVVGTAVNHSSRHVPLGPWRVSSLPPPLPAVLWPGVEPATFQSQAWHLTWTHIMFCLYNGTAKRRTLDVFSGVSLDVCLFVCEHDNFWTSKLRMTKLDG